MVCGPFCRKFGQAGGQMTGHGINFHIVMDTVNVINVKLYNHVGNNFDGAI